MDVIPDLLTSVLIPKVESTPKYAKQKKKQYKQQTLADKDDAVDETGENEKKAKLVEKRSNWVEKDRRSTNDRRKQVAKRGRWLESRDVKDRRHTVEGISISI